MISIYDFKSISDLDLEPIKVKLMHKPSGEGWSAEKASAVEIEYRRFLYLMKAFPTEQTAPLVDVDTFWHYHILDTMKYAVDCEHAFGYFLHHYPYAGILGDNCEEEREAGGNHMQELYEQTFGDSYALAARAIAVAGNIGAATNATENMSAYCWRSDGQATTAAYCWRTDRKETKAAYCWRTDRKETKAAYCWRTDQEDTKAAYCWRTDREETKAAYCWRSDQEASSLRALPPTQVAYRIRGGQQDTHYPATNDAAYSASSAKLVGNLLPLTDLDRLAA